jgi:hypothetical protein
VKYLIVGGYAVALHGHPRYTKDIDIWISPEPENAGNLIQALKDFGFSFPNLNVSDFTTPDMIVQLGYPPNRIDLLTDVSGVDFDSCYQKKMELEVEGITVNFIDLDSLKINKLASGRHQDLADLEHLE